MRLNRWFIRLVYSLIILALLLAWRPLVHLNKGRGIIRNEAPADELEDQKKPEGPTAKLGYVVTLKFTGQQAAGIRGVFSQKCWLKQFDLPMSIVEPFVTDSTLSHSKRLWDSEITTKPHFSNFYQTSTYLEMTNWKTFLKVAPRKLIVLTIQNAFVKGCLVFTKRPCIRKNPIPEQMKCVQTRELTNAVDYLKSKGFQIVRNICLNCSDELHGASPTDITEYIFQGHKASSVTLLVNRWKFSFEISPDCKRGCHQGLDEVSLLPAIARDARKHLEVLKLKLGYEGWSDKSLTIVGVMVRLEWFMISRKNRTLEELGLCFAHIQTTIDAISQRTGNEVLLILALDIGRFGSGTFPTTIRLNHFSPQYVSAIEDKVKDMVFQLYKKQMNFEEWEGTFDSVVEGNPDRGYIATLQAEEVGGADCLILMGGGHFQVLAKEQFTRRNPTNKCIHYICHM